jgi:hypothetical protein
VAQEPWKWLTITVLELTVADVTYPGGKFYHIILRVMQWVGSEYAWREEMHATFYLVKT